MTPTPGFGSGHSGVLQLEIERLLNTGRVLYVAAHPDDENTRFISHHASAGRYRVAYLSITRGDGGQNRIGTEIGAHLGVIRSMELGRARSIDGGEQFFTRASDFGYSKSSEESLEVWGHDAVLSDVVWVVRKFRPHVIVTRFPEEGQTHGHHLASAILAREAFEAAGDGTRFPDQLDEVQPWQPERVLYNQPSWWRKPDAESHVVQDVGDFIPQLGMNIPEIAATSRTSHKSQGFGSIARYDRTTEYYVTVAGSRPAGHLFSGIDTTWGAIAGGGSVRRGLERALEGFDAARPESALPGLWEAYRSLERVEDRALRESTRARLADVIAGCAGMRITLRSESPTVVAGGTLELRADVVAQRAELEIVRARLLLDGRALAEDLEFGRDGPLRIAIPASATPSAIDWLKKESRPAEWSGLDAAPFAMELTLKLGGGELTLRRPVVYPNVDPVLGERDQLVRVEPTITVTPAQPVLTLLPGQSKVVTFRLRANAPAATGTLSLSLPDGVRAVPDEHRLNFGRVGDEQLLGFELVSEGRARGVVVPTVDGADAWARTVIDYPHLAPTVVLEPATMSAVSIELDTSRVRGPIAYVQGTGDRVAELLSAVGLDVEIVEPTDLVPEKLQRFHAVMMGVRAFNVRPELFTRVDGLLGFVESGGTLIVQYNTNNWIDSLARPIGPYPFEISRKRVTDQTAVVTVKSDILSGPNRLRDADFEGWVQERGLYFASTWDERYVTPFEMNDPGEEPLAGSTLVANYGEGRFIYTGISFFRQLPAGVPGAYRLLVNMLSHPHDE